VRGVAAPSFIAKVLDLEALRDGFDPQLIGHPVHCAPMVRYHDSPITLLNVAAPQPAAVFLLLAAVLELDGLE
jgi:hypothetical protein